MALQIPAKQSTGGYIAVPLLLALVGFLVYLFWQAPTETSALDGPDEEASALPLAPAPKFRCGSVSGAAARVGDAAAVGNDGDDDALDTAPYAAEVGRSAALVDGFAVGAKRQLDSAAVAEVRLLRRDGVQQQSIALGPLRGDGDAPLVAALAAGAAGDGWVAAMLEPNAGGWSLRIVWQHEGQLRWGAEIDQGRDESLAFDLAYGERVGVVVWDDIDAEAQLSVVSLVRLGRADHQQKGKSRVVSGAVDAEVPRLARRDGGFWLAYVARAPSQVDEEEEGQGGDARYRAQEIRPSWIELLPLDADGLPQGAATPLTPKEGYVQTFDLATARNGEDAVVVWREDDTPSGAHGGRVLIMHISQGGAVQTQVVAEEKVGAGVPRLLPGWLAVSGTAGVARLAPLDDDGALAGELLAEPSLGRAQPIGAHGDKLLLVRPYGRAMDLPVVSCDASRHLLTVGANKPPDDVPPKLAP